MHHPWCVRGFGVSSLVGVFVYAAADSLLSPFLTHINSSPTQLIAESSFHSEGDHLLIVWNGSIQKKIVTFYLLSHC